MSDSPSLRKVKRSDASKVRDEGQQLEYQRIHPHLFTTLTQVVNADGTITTFDQVTSKLQETLRALNKHHKEKFGGGHPLYCLRPVVGMPEHDVCNMIEILNNDLDKVRQSFVRNCKDQVERLRSSMEYQAKAGGLARTSTKSPLREEKETK